MTPEQEIKSILTKIAKGQEQHLADLKEIGKLLGLEFVEEPESGFQSRFEDGEDNQ